MNRFHRPLFWVPCLTCMTALLGFTGCMPVKQTIVPAVRGRVISFDGKPVPGADVELFRKPDSVGRPFDVEFRCDANGDFSYAGEHRWVIWIIVGDLFPETVQVQARHAGLTSQVRDLKLNTELKVLGLGPERVHDLGQLTIE